MIVKRISLYNMVKKKRNKLKLNYIRWYFAKLRSINYSILSNIWIWSIYQLIRRSSQEYCIIWSSWWNYFSIINCISKYFKLRNFVCIYYPCSNRPPSDNPCLNKKIIIKKCNIKRSIIGFVSTLLGIIEQLENIVFHTIWRAFY